MRYFLVGCRGQHEGGEGFGDFLYSSEDFPSRQAVTERVASKFSRYSADKLIITMLLELTDEEAQRWGSTECK